MCVFLCTVIKQQLLFLHTNMDALLHSKHNTMKYTTLYIYIYTIIDHCDKCDHYTSDAIPTIHMVVTPLCGIPFSVSIIPDQRHSCYICITLLHISSRSIGSIYISSRSIGSIYSLHMSSRSIYSLHISSRSIGSIYILQVYRVYI